MQSKQRFNSSFLARLRTSYFTKFTIYLMVFSFLFISCSPDKIMISPSDSYQLGFKNSEKELGLYNSMELVRSVAVANDIQSPEKLLSFFSGVESSEPIENLVSAMQEETDRFNELGYESYIEEKVSLGELSGNMKVWLLEYEKIVLSFLETKPSEDEFMSYFDQERNFYDASNFSQNEIDLITKTLSDAKEYAKYYYLHYSMDDDSRAGDCGFWRGLGCALLYVAIVATVIVVIYNALLALVSAALAGGGSLIIAGTEITAQLGARAIQALLLLVLKDKIPQWSQAFFNWCCGYKEDVICVAPIGAYVQNQGCNTFKYTIFGPGTYTTTTWDNENTIPMTAVTPTPSLVVSVPTIGIPSTFTASTLCTELPSGNINTFPWVEVLTLSSGGSFSLDWLQEPPNEISWQDFETAERDIELSVTPVNESLYSFEWEVIGSASIESYGPYASIYVEDEGEIIINITATNKCTEESQSLTKTITITE